MIRGNGESFPHSEKDRQFLKATASQDQARILQRGANGHSNSAGLCSCMFRLSAGPECCWDWAAWPKAHSGSRKTPSYPFARRHVTTQLWIIHYRVDSKGAPSRFATDSLDESLTCQGNWPCYGRILLLAWGVNRQISGYISRAFKICDHRDHGSRMQVLVGCDGQVEIDVIRLVVCRRIDYKQTRSQVYMQELPNKGVTTAGKGKNRDLACQIVAVSFRAEFDGDQRVRL